MLFIPMGDDIIAPLKENDLNIKRRYPWDIDKGQTFSLKCFFIMNLLQNLNMRWKESLSYYHIIMLESYASLTPDSFFILNISS